MQVRIFEAADMASGLKMVRQELGPDALILSTRTVKNGKLGILGRAVLEITAAIDTPWPKEKNGAGIAGPYQATASTGSQSIGRRINCTVDDRSAFSPPQESCRFSRPPLGPDENSRQPLREEDPSANDIRREFAELRELVKDLAGTIARQTEQAPELQTPPVQPGEPPPSPPLQARLHAMRPPADHLIEYLLDLGIDLETAKTMTCFARESLLPADLENDNTLHTFFSKIIEDLIVVGPPDFKGACGQHRLALVGPTGVGKTTTLAKLAAHYLAHFSHSIALITIDTYRIAAVEQLKVYGEIMHLPVEVVIAPEQLTQALDKHRDKELILIDTAGRSPKDALCIEELASFFPPELQISKHLVISATTRETELFDIINRFDRLGIDRTIFTKIDECSHLGALLNIQIHSGKPLSYVTNGQRVPEDLLEITKEKAAELIMSKHEGI